MKVDYSRHAAPEGRGGGRLAIVVNPLARQMRRDPRLPARLAAIAHGAPLYVTAPDELPEIAASLLRDRVDLVAICGGDGTTHMLLTEMARHSSRLPRIALLGGGTINTVARNLGVSSDPEANLARLVAARALPTVTQTLLRVEDGTGPHLGFLFAALLGARFLAEYYDHPSPSPARALQLAIRVALSAVGSPSAVFAPAPLDLEIDGHAHHLDAARLLVAGTLPDVGVGMRIIPRAQARPDRFQLVAAGITPMAMARQIPAVQAGRRLEGDAIVDELCRTAKITFHSPEPYTLDGELYRAPTLTLSVAGPISIVRA